MLLKTSFLSPHLFCNVDFELIWLIEFLNKKSIEIIGFELTQPARDAPGTSPEGSLKVLTSGSSSRPSGDS